MLTGYPSPKFLVSSISRILLHIIFREVSFAYYKRPSSVLQANSGSLDRRNYCHCLPFYSYRRLEAQLAQIKTRIVEQNTLLSQRLAYYQQLQVKAQRRHMQVQAMRKGPMTAAEAPRGAASSLALLSMSASSASLLKHQRKSKFVWTWIVTSPIMGT